MTLAESARVRLGSLAGEPPTLGSAYGRAAEKWPRQSLLSTVTIKVITQSKHTTTYLHMHGVTGRESPVDPKRKEPKTSIQHTRMRMGFGGGSLEWCPLLPRRDLA